MCSIQEEYPSVSKLIAPQIRELLLYNSQQYWLQLGGLWLPATILSDIPYCFSIKEKVIDHAIKTPDIYSEYENLCFEAQSIDIICTSYLMNYETNLQKVMKELFRILKPNGYLFILGIRTPVDSKNVIKEKKRETLRRLLNAYTVCYQIKQEGGVVLKRQYYFDTPLRSLRYNSKWFSLEWIRFISSFLPNKHYYYFILAQKKPEIIPIISLKKPTFYFLNLKGIYAKG